MNYRNYYNFFSSQNAENKDLDAFYKEINEFQNVHYIPSVSLEVANFLKWISSFKKPKKILEIGFGSGTSALFIHKGYDRHKKFFSLELDKNRYLRGLELLKYYNIDSIDLILKKSFEFLKKNRIKFDLIFLDGMKREYYLHIEPFKKIMNKNGILICDNILFGGRILEKNVDNKYKNGVKYMRLFNEMIFKEKSFDTFFLPIGDGISISLKK